MELVITQNTTLDGVIDAADGWFGAGGDDDVLEALMELTAREDGMLLGRRTFEELRGYWPLQTDDRTGITASLNSVTKHVVSSTMTDPEWENSVIVDGPLTPAVQALREAPGRDLCVTGSIQLCQHLVENGLVDEYRLFVFPLVLGRGRRLFPDGVRQDLQLVDSRRFRSGITLQTYRPA